MKKIILKPGREESLRRRHPWVFSGAVQSAGTEPASGETVLLLDSAKKPLALGAWSPGSQIRCRVWSFDTSIQIDAAFFKHRLQQAIELRRCSGFVQDDVSACRLVYSESDGLPGLIVDRYGRWLVVQFLSAGAEYWKDIIVAVLHELIPGHSVFERSDAGVREKEHLLPRTGALSGDEPPEHIEIIEHGLHYRVDIRRGHKTGFYLDQRDNRRRIAKLASGEVLNCFSYTGGFALAALAVGADCAINIDSSAGALEQAAANARLNGIDNRRMENIEANVFEQLREFKHMQRHFDLIVLDPPKLIDSKQTLDRGARAYKDANLQALSLLKPGGLLMTFSCSGLLPTQLFQKIVADAALDAGRQAVIVERLGQSADHPVALNFPEGEYLKGLCIRVE
ncbi:MAG TPA: class I SAM-dependent methyltransferase [Gammaproteobacteria bacterium]|nr:class I SAM-dependent methyltransferase [Gammaproteobacteria bacterium]